MEAIPDPLDVVLFLSAKLGVGAVIVTLIASVAALREWAKAGKFAATRLERFAGNAVSSPQSFGRLIVLQTLFVASTLLIARIFIEANASEEDALGDTWSVTVGIVLARALFAPFDTVAWWIFGGTVLYLLLADFIAPHSSDVIEYMSIAIGFLCPGAALYSVLAVVHVTGAHGSGITMGSWVVGVVAPLVVVVWWRLADAALQAPVAFALHVARARGESTWLGREE